MKILFSIDGPYYCKSETIKTKITLCTMSIHSLSRNDSDSNF